MFGIFYSAVILLCSVPPDGASWTSGGCPRVGDSEGTRFDELRRAFVDFRIKQYANLVLAKRSNYQQTNNFLVDCDVREDPMMTISLGKPWDPVWGVGGWAGGEGFGCGGAG